MTPEAMISLIFGLSVASAWFFALLWWSDRRHTRVMADRQAEREDRQMYAQRVQAPELAPYQHAQATTPDGPQPEQHVPFDDDEAFWAAQERQDALRIAPIGLNPLGAE
jgi:hypothetical protein